MFFIGVQADGEVTQCPTICNSWWTPHSHQLLAVPYCYQDSSKQLDGGIPHLADNQYANRKQKVNHLPVSDRFAQES